MSDLGSPLGESLAGLRHAREAINESSTPVPVWVPYLFNALEAVLGGMENIMAAQDDINNAITAIGAVLTDVQADVATLGTDLQSWITANPAVDTSGLAPLVASAQAAQAALDTQVQAITAAVVPAPVTPPAGS